MNRAQELQIKKFVEFRNFLMQNPALLEQHSDSKPHYEAFLNYLNIILKSKEMMEESLNQNYNYNLLKEDLIKVALSVSRKVTAYALLEELMDVQGMFCYTYEELSREPDEKILIKCSNLLQFILKCKNELSDYGIDDQMNSHFRDLIDQFHYILESEKLYKETAQSTNDQLEHIIKESNDIYIEKLQSLSEIFTLKTT
jgi:hypothetical protein